MKIIAPKKLIEVALPLDDINKAAAREKSIRHGHPSTLHLWWARRPLAAARAVIFSQMVNMPGWQHEVDGTVPTQYQKANYTKRKNKLFGIIRRLVQWENTNNEEVLKEAREEIWNSWRETCEYNKGIPGFDPEKLPAFHDPFAGGGALPLEAQRLGLESYASDLNPVAVMINKAMIEIPPKFANRPPVGPLPPGECEMDASRTWKGAEGLAEDVRRYGYWMREEAKKRIGHLYPKVEITADMAKERPDLKPYVGQKLTVIAWLWARTVKSPNPEFAHVDVPLIASFVLATKDNHAAYVQPVVKGDKYDFRVLIGECPSELKTGTKAAGQGADFNCILSGSPITGDYIKDYAKEHGFGQRLFAIVCDGPDGRVYLPPVADQEKVAIGCVPGWKPEVKFCPDALGFRVGNYGMLKWSDLYSGRQAVALEEFLKLVAEVRAHVNAASAGDSAYADAVATYLGMAVSRITHYWSNLSSWHKSGEKLQCVFARQAVPMVWDFAECNVFSDSSGNWIGGIDWVSEAISMFQSPQQGVAQQADAQTQSVSDGKVIATDPPYYDNIGYADLSDFFYVWLQKGLKGVYPALFNVISTPKDQELVATPCRHGGKKSAAEFFLVEMTKTMSNIAQRSHVAFPVPIFYAFK